MECVPCTEQLCISCSGHSDVKYMKGKKHKMVIENRELKNAVNSYV